MGSAHLPIKLFSWHDYYQKTTHAKFYLCWWNTTNVVNKKLLRHVARISESVLACLYQLVNKCLGYKTVNKDEFCVY